MVNHPDDEARAKGENRAKDGPAASAGAEQRAWRRVACRTEGVIDIAGTEGPLQLVDVSTGGCKFRVPGREDAIDALGPLPIEFVLTSGLTDFPGAIIWRVSRMFGCKFFEHQSLDKVAEIMGGDFRIRLIRPKL